MIARVLARHARWTVVSRVGYPLRSGGPETGATCSGPLAWLYRKSVLSRGVVAPSASDRGQPLFFTIKKRPRQPEGSPGVQILFWPVFSCAPRMPGATAGPAQQCILLVALAVRIVNSRPHPRYQVDAAIYDRRNAATIGETSLTTLPGKHCWTSQQCHPPRQPFQSSSSLRLGALA